MGQLSQCQLWTNDNGMVDYVVRAQRGTELTKGLARDRIVSVDEFCMLEAIHHLRYVNVNHIWSVWYPTRTMNACAVRVSRLLHSDFLRATRYAHPGTRAYSLGAAGYRKLRDLRGFDLYPLPKLHALTIPHQLDTNQVFTTLTNGRALPWADMPFRWRGSHEVTISYQDTRPDEDGIPRSRSASLKPDATVTYGTTGPRCFLELDRSTECLREADERRSLRGKLRAYQAALCKGPIGAKTTWYGQAFTDGRSPRLVFVLARSHALPRVHAQRHRRMNGIRSAAKELAAGVDVRVVYLDDHQGIREAFSFPSVSTPVRSNEQPVRLAEVQRLENFCRLAKAACEDEVASSVHKATREALAVLERMGVRV